MGRGEELEVAAAHHGSFTPMSPDSTVTVIFFFIFFFFGVLPQVFVRLCSDLEPNLPWLASPTSLASSHCATLH